MAAIFAWARETVTETDWTCECVKDEKTLPIRHTVSRDLDNPRNSSGRRVRHPRHRTCSVIFSVTEQEARVSGGSTYRCRGGHGTNGDIPLITSSFRGRGDTHIGHDRTNNIDSKQLYSSVELPKPIQPSQHEPHKETASQTKTRLRSCFVPRLEHTRLTDKTSTREARTTTGVAKSPMREVP